MALRPDAGVSFPLMLLLALKAGRWVTRSEILEAVWPEIPPPRARAALRQALYRLRHAGLVLEDRPDAIRLDRALVDSDLARVTAPGWSATAEDDEVERARHVLPEFSAQSEQLASLCDDLRMHVERHYEEALLVRLAAARAQARWVDVERWAGHCLDVDPLNEDATFARAEAAAMRGAPTVAMAVLDHYLTELGPEARGVEQRVKALRKRLSLSRPNLDAPLLLTPLPFVGRQVVVREMLRQLQAAKAGAAQACCVVGPSGIGKSRLLQHVREIASGDGWHVIATDARPTSAEQPLAMVIDTLRVLLEAPGAMGTMPEALQLLRTVCTLTRESSVVTTDDVLGRQHALFRAWLDLLDAILSEARLLIVLDDIQWADERSMKWFAQTLDARPGATLAVCCAARRLPDPSAGETTPWLKAPLYRLGRLVDDDVALLVSASGAVSPGEEPSAVEGLSRASGGHPLFLLHLLQHLRLGGTLSRLPADVTALVDGRLAALVLTGRRVLEACALLGRHSTISRVARTLDVTAAELVAPLATLGDLLILAETADARLVVHDIWMDAARRAMPEASRRSLALSAARQLEADATATDSPVLLWDACGMYQEAGESILAFEPTLRCARYFAENGLPAEAGRAYTQAVASAGSPTQRREAWLGLLAMQRAGREWPELLRTIAAIHHDGGPKLHAEAEATLALHELEARSQAEDPATGLPRLQTMIADERLSLPIRQRALLAAIATANYVYKRPVLEELFAQRATLSLDEGEQRGLQLRVIYGTATGALELADRSAQGLLECAAAARDVGTMCMALRYAGATRRLHGDRVGALAHYREAKVLAGQHMMPYAEALAGEACAVIQAERGELDDAEATLLGMERTWDDRLGRMMHGQVSWAWAFVLAALGRYREARERLGAIDDPRTLDSRTYTRLEFEALALRLTLQQNRPELARQHLDFVLAERAFLDLYSPTVDRAASAVCEGLIALVSREAAVSFARQCCDRQAFRRSVLPPAVLNLAASA